MATRFKAGFGRSPGRVRQGSTAFHGKNSAQSAKNDMAEIIRKYEQLIRSMQKATPQILYDAMMPAFNRSQVYVPKKTGNLMASGVLRVVPTAGERAEVEIMYGGPNARYAAIVHEMTGLNHVPPTSAKYLQRALEEELDAFIVSAAVDYAMLMGPGS